jgi:hypothetical protein
VEIPWIYNERGGQNAIAIPFPPWRGENGRVGCFVETIMWPLYKVTPFLHEQVFFPRFFHIFFKNVRNFF